MVYRPDGPCVVVVVVWYTDLMGPVWWWWYTDLMGPVCGGGGGIQT